MNNLKAGRAYVTIGKKGHFTLSSEKSDGDFEYGYVNTSVSLFSNYEMCYKDMTIMPTSDYLEYADFTDRADGFSVCYKCDTYDLTLKEDVEMFDGLNILRQKSVVKNTGKEKIVISRLAKANMLGIGRGGSKYFETDRFNIYYCINCMQSEGQWQKKSLRDLGIYPASIHPWEKRTFRLQSVGSWCSSDYYPMMVIEDKEKGECWFFENEGSENWFIELTAYEGFNCPFLTVAIGGGDEQSGWKYVLEPDESYETSYAVYGMVKGGFNDAVNELLKYKRQTSLSDKKIEVTFNDFMNCYWANPTAGRLIPLIDKAAELGVKRFCIDCGWSEVGEWDPLEEKFGSIGFDGIIKYIGSKGMVAGVWFEFDAISKEELKKHPEDFACKRNGRTIAEHRPKLNFTNKEAREWLFGKIDYVYKLGVRYIKNDHNNDEKIGIDNGHSFAEGLREKTKAFDLFIEELKRRYPDMILESCAAGGAREDNGTLKYFDLESASDQENYKLFPSILIGETCCIPPEKTGIWAYPCPLEYKYYENLEIPEFELEKQRDGRQTVFNMVSSMMGYMYLSGRIDKADEKNSALIKEAIEVYNGYKDRICEMYPELLVPFKLIGDMSYNAFGLATEDKREILVGVWVLRQKEFAIDLEKYGKIKAEKMYPARCDDISYIIRGGKLYISAKAENVACLLKITV